MPGVGDGKMLYGRANGDGKGRRPDGTPPAEVTHLGDGGGDRGCGLEAPAHALQHRRRRLELNAVVELVAAFAKPDAAEGARLRSPPACDGRAPAHFARGPGRRPRHIGEIARIVVRVHERTWRLCRRR